MGTLSVPTSGRVYLDASTDLCCGAHRAVLYIARTTLARSAFRAGVSGDERTYLAGNTGQTAPR